jgi:hypothetical protein
MIWNAPIWVNQLLLNGIMFAVYITVIICVVTPLIIIYIVIEELISKKTFKGIFKGKYLATLIGSLAISAVILVIFYLPLPIVQDEYEFSSLWISEYKDGINKESVSVDDEKVLTEFITLLKHYNCRRSFDSGAITDMTDTILLSTTIFKNELVSPLHFVVQDGRCLVYTAGNTDFIYLIEDKKKMLDDQIMAMLNRYVH